MRSLEALTVALAISAPLALPAVAAETVDGAAAFELLKTLEGTWRGGATGDGEAAPEAGSMPETVHEFRVASGGTVVMETMGVGTSDEMINMYHLDGDDLMLTHYCSGGNQPSMRLDPEASSDERLVFRFSGGTSLDPGEAHIHDAELTFTSAGQIDSVWFAHVGGEQVGAMRFHLQRDES